MGHCKIRIPHWVYNTVLIKEDPIILKVRGQVYTRSCARYLGWYSSISEPDIYFAAMAAAHA